MAIIKEHVRRGAYADGASYAATLTDKVLSSGAFAIELARLRMIQGRMRDAAAALAQADLGAASSQERALCQLEAAQLAIFRGESIKAAFEAARDVFNAASQALLSAPEM